VEECWSGGRQTGAPICDRLKPDERARATASAVGGQPRLSYGQSRLQAGAPPKRELLVRTSALLVAAHEPFWLLPQTFHPKDS
jgi:hypothetical protein